MKFLANPWVLLCIAAAWAVSLFVVGSWQNEAGRVAERVAWQARDNEALTAANATIQKLNDEARATEQAHTDRLAAISANIVKENQDAEARIRRAVAGARALVLRQQSASQSAGAGSPAAPTPAASGSDGAPACELPASTVRDLFQLVGDADTGMRQLAAAQAVILSDRKEAP